MASVCTIARIYFHAIVHATTAFVNGIYVHQHTGPVLFYIMLAWVTKRSTLVAGWCTGVWLFPAQGPCAQASGRRSQHMYTGSRPKALDPPPACLHVRLHTPNSRLRRCPRHRTSPEPQGTCLPRWRGISQTHARKTPHWQHERRADARHAGGAPTLSRAHRPCLPASPGRPHSQQRPATPSNGLPTTIIITLHALL